MTKLVFGVDRDPGAVPTRRGPLRLADPNPMVVAFGPGPTEKTCRDCRFLVRQGGVAGHYLKCRERGITSGYGTDHKAGWPTCRLFEERTEGTE